MKHFAWRAHLLLLLGLLAVSASGETVRVRKSKGAAEASEKQDPLQETLTVDKVLDHMEAVRKNLKTFRAEVIKLRYVDPLDDTETFEGTILFKRPRFLRLELRSKENGRRTIYIVGKEYGWIYRPDEQQAEGIPLKDLDKRVRRGNPLEYGLAADVRELKRSYDLALLPEERISGVETVALQMTPKGALADNKEGTVILWLSKESWMLVRIREYKNDGDIVETHTFTNLEPNVPIRDKVFRFKPGKEIDVIIHPAAD